MFMIGHNGDTLFFQGYGKTEVDDLTLAYYCYERIMEDVAEFAKHIWLTGASDESKQDAMGWFMVQFEPGSDLDKAHHLYQQLRF
jgi:spectinomycin phosphotransferase